MVQPGNVRQSRKYNAQVSIAGANDFHDSFAYESIPRNGRGRIYSPWDAPGSNTLGSDVDDGITIELGAGINMAWSQFEYSANADVKILPRDGTSFPGPSGVKVRPTSIGYDVRSSGDGGIIIRVPRDPNGRRFSVEFDNDLFTYRSNGTNYVTSGGDVVGVEPRNALLIFASPFLPDDMVPRIDAPDTKVMTPGPINQGDWGSSSVLYFPPGVYWMNSNPQGGAPRIGENHIRLSPNTRWVYLAPGAYVKGAIEYTTKSDFYATGHGVLSGEHYVYQANPATEYQALKSDSTSLRMWGHNALGGGQTWYCQGPTINAPPFNTMDFYGSADITTRISDYKQVGAFFFQTDGPQLYPNSQVHDVFYHVNDDAIKTYYSGASLTRATIWKGHNDPVIQMGWDTRDVSGVTLQDIHIIHTRYIKSETYVPSAIIGASPFYRRGRAVDSSKAVSLTIKNLVCEGVCPALMRITPLQNYRNFLVQDVAFPDELQTNSIGTGKSIVPASSEGLEFGVTIANWTVGGQKVTMDNFQSDRLGQLDIDVSYSGQWTIR
ncbi:hypothetical protein NEMBOFW57_004657 [Staphylotrichum longicolle]|uniref:Dextranase n=1 Tax=Staphylotrichum longicolle TaxID=669026 RepID=A0AAD4F790_9PEZI|nr:hypothetical protein NEMBOFW57_004657 [Staphylotrichum longicolle]